LPPSIAIITCLEGKTLSYDKYAEAVDAMRGNTILDLILIIIIKEEVEDFEYTLRMWHDTKTKKDKRYWNE
jgi:hypothetical protein